MATTAQSAGARPASNPPAPDTNNAKRGKINRKTADPVNTSKAIEDTIAQLERSKAGEHEQEAEIEREAKRATRDLNKELAKIPEGPARIDAVTKRFAELYADMKRHEREHQKSKKRADQLQKEKDSNRSELTKAVAVKDKLEKLCRELQKDNKNLKQENKKLCDDEIRNREELHSRLEDMVDNMQDFIDQKENPELIPVNMKQDEIFRAKFKSFIEQYEVREIQMHSLLRVKQYEVDYYQAKAEEQRRIREQEASKSRQLTSQVSTFSQTETELRSQLNIYVEKFKQVIAKVEEEKASSRRFKVREERATNEAVMEDARSAQQIHAKWAAAAAAEMGTSKRFVPTPWDLKGHGSTTSPPGNVSLVEDTLNNSNDLFLTFRREMEEMSKKTKRLEKENQNLTRRHETTNHNILQMAEDRTRVNKELETLRRKNENLEKLCRGMQAQGRGSAPMVPHTANSGAVVPGEYDEGEVTESEYEYGDEELSEDFEDEEHETETEAAVNGKVFGPVPPAATSQVHAGGSAVKANGVAQPKAQANGVRH